MLMLCGRLECFSRPELGKANMQIEGLREEVSSVREQLVNEREQLVKEKAKYKLLWRKHCDKFVH